MLNCADQSALVVVDPQKAFVDAHGSLARAYGIEEILPSIQALVRLEETLTAVRDAGIRVVLVRSEYEPGQFATGHLDTPLSHVCVPGANVDCEWADGLTIGPADEILTKTGADAFTTDRCRARLQALVNEGIRVFYFAGFQLTTCVKATAMSSARLFGPSGVRSVVLAAATGARASSHYAPADGRSRVEATYAELMAAGVEIAGDNPF